MEVLGLVGTMGIEITEGAVNGGSWVGALGLGV